MPRSSVYVRLQWPAEGGSEEAGATCLQNRDTPQPPSLHSIEKTLHPEPSLQEPQQPSGEAGRVHQGSVHSSEGQQEHQVVLKCSTCSANCQGALHLATCAKSPSNLPLSDFSVPVHGVIGSVIASPASTCAATLTTATTTNTTSLAKHSHLAEPSPGTQVKVKGKMKDTPKDKLRRNLTERIPGRDQTKERTVVASHSHRTPLLDTSHSLDSPLWHSREQTRVDGEGEPQDGCQEGAGNKPGIRTFYKSKTRLRPRNPNAKGRRITRSLSASCVSVSTNTDPKDFLELAKISGTLYSKKKKNGEETHASKQDTPRDADPTSPPPGRTEAADGSDVWPVLSKGPPDVEIGPKGTPKAHVELTGEENEKSCKPETSTESNTTAEATVEEDITEKPSDTRCAGDGCDDAGKGYIELPTYIPSHPPIGPKEERLDPLPSFPTNPPISAALCGPPYPSFHAHTSPLPFSAPSYFTQVSVKGSSPEENKFIVITPHLPRSPSLQVKVETAPSAASSPPSSPSLMFSTLQLGSSSSCDHNQTFSTFRPAPTRTFLFTSQDDTDLSTFPHSTSPSSGLPFTLGKALPPEALHHETVLPRGLSSQCTVATVSERCRRSDKNLPAYPANRPPTPAVPRRHLERDMSLDSCPDVVLQTLEAEGASSQNKTLKKSVTFLLPPGHWDSLISVQEGSSTSAWTAGRPASLHQRVFRLAITHVLPSDNTLFLCLGLGLAQPS